MEKQILILKVCIALLTLTSAISFGVMFKMIKNQKFGEIEVERINVVESDGKLRLVISNQARQHPGTMDGITYDERKGHRPPGLMFFGENGNEVGGLVFDGNEGKGQGGSLTFDKFRGDQTVQFIHEESVDGSYFAGLKVNDQNMPLNDLMDRQKEIEKLPSKEARDLAYAELRNQGLLTTERLRIGKERDKASIIKMKDAKGRIRLELKVESNGNPKISFYDELGKITHSLPSTSKSN